jgi:hypothetical protein
MTSTGLLTSAEIRARLDAGLPALEDVDSDYWDWDNTLDDIINSGDPQVDEYSVRAFLKYLDVSARHEERLTPKELADEIQQRYRGYWSDAAKFAREYAADDWAEMGEQHRGRGEALTEFADFIDWAAYADTPEFTSRWALITLDGEGVHAFEED